MSDGGLRKIFQKHLPDAHWQSVETWSTGQGVPDLNYCMDGREGWLELKATKGWRVTITPEQVAWIERRSRNGGNVAIAVRRKTSGGPRAGAPADELWLFPAREARRLMNERMTECDRLGRWVGGPNQWNWLDIKGLLKRS